VSSGGPVGAIDDGAHRHPPAGPLCSEVLSMSDSTIRIQVLLRPQWRTPGGIEEARNALIEAGLRPTAAGLATISAELDPDGFRSLFGTSATEVPPRRPGAGDFGRSGGHVSEPLEVPPSLERYVESISVAPGHSYFQN
jgi:hypothetical protein